jgi:hypothetical protein
MRPRFPSSAPRAYADLAAACWASDPAARPGFGAIIGALHRMANAMAAPAPRAASDCGRASGGSGGNGYAASQLQELRREHAAGGLTAAAGGQQLQQQQQRNHPQRQRQQQQQQQHGDFGLAPIRRSVSFADA